MPVIDDMYGPLIDGIANAVPNLKAIRFSRGVDPDEGACLMVFALTRDERVFGASRSSGGRWAPLQEFDGENRQDLLGLFDLSSASPTKEL